jgi:peptidoglycan/xylan/chitin deacetylase (PgdA/CDA1 family)
MINFRPLNELVRRGFRRPSGIVLLYHRVHDPKLDPQLLSVTPQIFRKQLEALARVYEPATLDALLNEGSNGRARFAVTFDDGYLDNFTVAAPIAHEVGVPLSIFVATGAARNPALFFWDYLKDLLLCSEPLTQTDLLLIGAQLQGRGEILLSSFVATQVSPHWNVLYRGKEGLREKLYRAVCARLETLPVVKRLELISSLEEPIGWRPESGSTLVNLANLGELSAGLEIGAHSVAHSNLARESAEFQRQEIFESKLQLEHSIGRRVRYFAYPFGGPSHVSSETLSLTEQAGYRAAFMNVPGAISSGQNRFKLPRLLVRNEDPNALLARIQRWTWGL